MRTTEHRKLTIQEEITHGKKNHIAIIYHSVWGYRHQPGCLCNRAHRHGFFCQNLASNASRSRLQGVSCKHGREMTHLRGCPKDTLMVHERPGDMCYAFADPATNSMYIGDEAAYQRLKSIMQRQQQPIQEQRIKEDPEFWKMWGSRRGLG